MWRIGSKNNGSGVTAVDSCKTAWFDLERSAIILVDLAFMARGYPDFVVEC